MKPEEERVKQIPEDRLTCKWCSNCECYSPDQTGTAICNADIGEAVDVDSDYCPEFDYDDTFTRT